MVKARKQCAATGFDIVDDRVRTAGDFFRGDRGRYQTQARNGGGAVAQRVDALVGRHEPCALRGDRATRTLEANEELVRLEFRAHALDRLHLIERPAGVAKRPPRELRHDDATRGNPRNHDQRSRIADAARGVFVDDARSGRAQRFAARNERIGQRQRLVLVQSAAQAGH